MEKLVKLALKRLDDLDLEQRFLDSRKATRYLIASTFVNNLDIVRRFGSEEVNLDLDEYLKGIKPIFKKFLLEYFPWVKLEYYRPQEITKFLIPVAVMKLGSQKAVADYLGVSKPMVTYLVQGKRGLTVNNLLKLLEVTGMKLKIRA